MNEPEPLTDDLLEIADALVPGAPLDRARRGPGGVHDVVLLPGVAAVRVSRRPLGAAQMPRGVEILRAVRAAGPPFEVPEPLTPVTDFGERRAVAVSWLDGTGLPEGQGDPGQIAGLLAALRELPVTEELRGLLPAPRAHDGHWARVLEHEVLPRLPERLRPEAERRLAAALELETVPDVLVHGDLAGDNVHWAQDGTLVGVLDWDRAQLFDPAIDAAFMAWHGWENVRAAVDADTCRRARVWDRLFGVNILCAVFTIGGDPLPLPDSYARHIAAWMEAEAGAVR
ncbi:aminoglycoside phosphotransferase family protein [Nonomuraea sp. NPDC049504]|uniref:aminoglycoside phosphotransferase family protein n=1 Tax=Nonomuraea sp. NPDC049504 TaxID=3154729 RepID=UPI0034405785